MAVSFNWTSGNWKWGSLSALAIGMALASLPAAAQDQGRRGPGGEARSGGGFERPQHAERDTSGWRAQRSDSSRAERPATEWRSAPQVRQQAPAPETTRSTAPAEPRWQAGNTESRPGTRTRGDESWSGRTRSETRASNSGWEGSRRAAPETEPSGDRVWARNSDDDRRRSGEARRERDDDNRRAGEGWRGRDDDNRRAGEGWRGRENERWRNDDRRREAARDYRRDGYRDGYRPGYRDWNRDWRRDNRYNWYSYRATNRHHYRLGSYYAPYRNYSYRRLTIGFYLDSLFFSSRYWISDPWSYRLPPAYGPYRWVRYYDDVLLVDIYSGEVIDVIHDFFW
ncbi:MAG TPA: RcnB family protein [Novosphingobium sp.]|nr:RcnB family protein [Novosphingobium sp.]